MTRPSPLLRCRSVGLVLGLALASLVGASCGDRPEPVVDRVILIGLDGLDWQVLEPLVKAGKVPNLARFLARGSSGKLRTLLPTYSPIIWSSVITGKVKEKHGIVHFGRPDPERKRPFVPFTSNSRRARALWSILGEQGRRVGSVGWWTTWPAEEVPGVMVSDRLMHNRFNVWLGMEKRGAGLPRQTHPEELVDELLPLVVSEDEALRDVFRRFFPDLRKKGMRHNLHDPVYEVYLTWARDKSYARFADRVFGTDDFSFFALYFNGIDIASHYLWKYRFPEQWPEKIPDEEIREYGRVIDTYCEAVDEMIGPYLEMADEDCLVIVVSDHGFRAGARQDSPNISGIHYNLEPPGVIAMAGGPVGEGGEIRDASIYDITPSVLYALGHRVGRDMDGKVLPDVKIPDHPVFYCETYEGPPRSEEEYAPIPSEFDAARAMRLKALGYLEDDGGDGE